MPCCRSSWKSFAASFLSFSNCRLAVASEGLVCCRSSSINWTKSSWETPAYAAVVLAAGAIAIGKQELEVEGDEEKAEEK